MTIPFNKFSFGLSLNGQIISSDLNETHKIIQQVDFDTIFDIQVQAKSTGGIGPKSEPWIVKSWPKLPSNPMLYLLTHKKMEARNLLGQVKVNKIENITDLFIPTSNFIPKYLNELLTFFSLKRHQFGLIITFKRSCKFSAKCVQLKM